MKKLALSTILILFVYIPSLYAQEVEWSAKAGLNFSTLGNFLPKIGYHAGMAAEFITTPYFSIQPELVYSLQGATIDRTQGIYKHYHYLTLPLLFKVYFVKEASFDLGAQYGYLLKAVNRDDLGSENITDIVNRHDFALVLGFSYKLDEKIVLGLRYNLGLSNTGGGGNAVNWDQRFLNKTLQLSGAFVF